MYDILFIGLFLIIIYQDFRYRAIDWYLLPIVAVIVLFKSRDMIQTVIFHFFINSVFLVMNSLALVLFFSLKKKKLFNPLNVYVGIGDLIFFLVTALLFSPVIYVLFFTLSLLLTLSTYLIIFKVLTKQEKEIPLAGFVSILLVGLVLYRMISGFDFQDDTWALKYIFLNGIY